MHDRDSNRDSQKSRLAQRAQVCDWCKQALPYRALVVACVHDRAVLLCRPCHTRHIRQQAGTTR